MVQMTRKITWEGKTSKVCAIPECGADLTDQRAFYLYPLPEVFGGDNRTGRLVCTKCMVQYRPPLLHINPLVETAPREL